MVIRELKPTTRVFEFVPTVSDTELLKYATRVFLDCDEYMLRVQSACDNCCILIRRNTGDIRKDLISMTQDDLLSFCSFPKRFLFEESKNLVLKNIENACIDLNFDLNDKRVQDAIEQINDIDDDDFLDPDQKRNECRFVGAVHEIIRNSPLKNAEDDIAKVVTKYQSFAESSVGLIVKYLYPILQREINLRSDEITKEEIVSGLQNGIVRIVNNASDGCISAMIGEHWFYFTGMEDESMNAELYLKRYNYDEIATMIHDTINQPPIKDAYDDTEWRYYKCILNRA